VPSDLCLTTPRWLDEDIGGVLEQDLFGFVAPRGIDKEILDVDPLGLNGLEPIGQAPGPVFDGTTNNNSHD